MGRPANTADRAVRHAAARRCGPYSAPMRAHHLVLSILLAAPAACGADGKPAAPARGATVPARASDAPPAGTAHRYVGLRSADLLLELPAPLLGRGERVLGDSADLGIVSVGTEGGGELLFLDRRTEKGDFEVLAVLELPAGVSADRVAWDGCHAGARPDPHVVAVVAAGAGCEAPGGAVVQAWRVNEEARRFEPIDAGGITCLAPTCETGEEGGVVGGVEGGVEGGVPGGVEGGVSGGVVGGQLGGD